MPLTGLRVLEIGKIPAASYCARLFADFGADVLKIEPRQGDAGRGIAPLVAIGGGRSEGGYFGFLNYNKRSATADSENADEVFEIGLRQHPVGHVTPGVLEDLANVLGIPMAEIRAEGRFQTGPERQRRREGDRQKRKHHDARIQQQAEFDAEARDDAPGSQ